MLSKWRNHTELLGFILATGLLFGSGAAQASTYRNMISDGDAPDPGVTYVSGSVGGASDEYLGATTNNPPGYIRIYRSANLHTLFRDAHVDIALPSGVGGLWAPELHTFPSYPGLWLYFTGLESAGTYTWVFEITDLNTGAWNNHGRVLGFGSNYDFSIFERSIDGTLWGFFAFGNEHLEAVRMSNPYTAQGNTLREIYTATHWWESTMAGVPPFVEAPFPFEKNGTIFLSYSAAGWKWDAYCLGVLRWDGPAYGDLTQTSWTNLTGDTGPEFSSANGLYATGHNSIVKVRDGDYWNVYHAHTESCGNSCNTANLPRYTGMNKVEWDGSGNPVFGAPTGTSTEVEIPDNAPGTTTAPFAMYVEAEAGSLKSPMDTSPDGTASGGVYISTSKARKGEANYAVMIPSQADYYVWGRVKARSRSADAFGVAFDSGTVDVYDSEQAGWVAGWQWTRVNGRSGGAAGSVPVRVFHLGAGTHTLKITGDDTGALLDRLFVTDSATAVPR